MRTVLNVLRIQFPFLCGLSIILFVSSCNSTKHLEEDQSLLVKNSVRVESSQKIQKKRDLQDNLNDIAYPDLNKKLLGVWRLKLWFYSTTFRKKQNKFRYWLTNKVGEPPVLYDEETVIRNKELMKNYLSNKGYFYNKVSSSVEFKRKKAMVTYSVEPKDLYFFDSVTYSTPVSRIWKIVESTKSASLVKQGDPFEIEKLKKERDRITEELQNQGYFLFNKEHITYNLDSSNAEKKIKVDITVNRPTDTSFHNVFFIDEVYVYPEYSFQNRVLKYADTLRYKDISLIFNELKIKPRVFRESIFLKKGRVYRKMDYSLTIKRLNGLGVFKFVNISFKQKIVDGKFLLDAYLYLAPAKKQTLGIDLDVNSNFVGLMGTGITFSYGNRNIFKAADLLSFNVSAGLELEFSKSVSLVNTADFSPEITYYLKRFVLPFRLKSLSRNANPRTRFSLGYKYQQRLNYYTLQSLNLSFGYEWQEAVNKKHILNPFNISFVKTSNESEDFLKRLEEDPFLKSSFDNQLILSTNYTYIQTTKKKHPKNFYVFRGSIDIAGNVLHGIMSLAKTGSSDTIPYKIFGREYSQYAKFEGDLRMYKDAGKHSRFAFRLNGGIGIPYGNSSVLPYVKQFYAGGANSLRAFDVRSVGPGTFADPNTDNVFGDQTGDILIEVNAEYRFDIIKWLKGAFFVDAGNIWLISNKTKPEGNFTSSFYREFAIGTGAGARLDFSFFVIRFDWAIPIRDPSRDIGDRWLFDKLQFKQFNFNLAIGYPF